MSVEDAATDFTLRQLETFGAFSLLFIVFGAIIWWLLKYITQKDVTWTALIVAKEAEIVKWQDRCFEESRDNAASKAEALSQITEAIAVVERLAVRGSIP